MKNPKWDHKHPIRCIPHQDGSIDLFANRTMLAAPHVQGYKAPLDADTQSFYKHTKKKGKIGVKQANGEQSWHKG